MGKIGNKELAAALADKYGLTKQASEKFVAAMFSIVNEGLNEDKQVKVKGLGTFKRIGVASRKSVDVNTGEPIIIKGRDKITFTPDATLRDEVNKPFMQFETVAVNEGVDFADIDSKYHVADEESEAPAQHEMPAKTEPETVVEEPKNVIEELKKEEEEAKNVIEVRQNEVEEPKNEVEEPKNEVKEPVIEVEMPQNVAENNKNIADSGPESTQNSGYNNEKNDDDDSDDDESDNGNKLRIMRYVVVAAVAALVICLCGAYYMYSQLQKKDHRIEHLEAQISTAPAKTAAAKTIPSKTVKTDADVTVDTTAAGHKTAKDAPEKTQDVANDTKYKADAAGDDFANMGKNDVRVRTGAYIIVGIDRTVEAREGQTLASISKAWLGPGMECYVEAVNSDVKELKNGDKVRIPKLKMKKLKKK